MTEPREFPVTESEPGIRLDTWLHRQVEGISRSTLGRLIDEGQVTVDGRRVKPRYTPKLGEVVTLTIPPARDSDLKPQAIPLDILFEDADLLVLNKAPGLCVHPSAGHPDGTIVNALLHHCQGELSGIGGVSRPGIVHRLDQDTSGCLVVAKNDAAHTHLADQFAARTVHKAYLAITCGVVRPKEGDIRANIARHPSHRKRMAISDGSGRSAHTSYHVQEDFEQASLVEAHLHTGRTHQIRVHFKHIGFPLFGDATYSGRHTKTLAGQLRFTPKRQLLHAWKLAFQHPTSQEPLAFEASLPADFQQTLEHLRSFRKRNSDA